MLNARQLEEMAKKIAEVIPQGLAQVPSGVQDQIKSTLSRTFEKMELVSRHEFDIQAGVLAKTRAKLEALEKVVAELEASIK
ncbi:accessory factor UbiK family protein [Thiomicrorhabdus arctica]|uniref:accessory factor UbiK family protein n=1 Tax=Thiomicrorhabdus arctica TaxID=131540 RepID=UPI000375F059|nr:accessory factor UbiK family protein [Thiomicrorhabdus arctica]